MPKAVNNIIRSFCLMFYSTDKKKQTYKEMATELSPPLPDLSHTSTPLAGQSQHDSYHEHSNN